MHESFPIARGVTLGLTLLALAGCSSDRGGLGFLTPEPSPAAKEVPATPPAPTINMAGRWTLASPGAGQCGMIFTTRGNGGEGSIAPEGGCPGDFFTSRRWTLEPGGLVIKNHKGKVLAQLASAGPGGSFDGKAVSGLPVTLAR